MIARRNNFLFNASMFTGHMVGYEELTNSLLFSRPLIQRCTVGAAQGLCAIRNGEAAQGKEH
jgi:hypothetical protein